MLSKAIGAANLDSGAIELLTERATIENLSALLRSRGSMLVCHLCDDPSAIIVGILVVRESEEAWVLCGPCMRQIPVQGPLAS